MAGLTRCKAADAVAEKYHIICPYKACNYNHIRFTATKGEMIKCENCRKEFKIRKIIAK